MIKPVVGFDQVFAQEIEHIREKRKWSGEESVKKAESNLFGIALSGGGVRSATIGAGFLEVLNSCGILRKADYLSTVSGGGYIGGYVQSKLHLRPDWNGLFSVEDQKYLQSHGDYLAPGQTFSRTMARIRLAGALVASLLMNWIWILLVALILDCLFGVIAELISSGVLSSFWNWLLWAALGVLCVHYFLHFLRYIHLWSSDFLNRIEGALVILILVSWALGLSTTTRILDLSMNNAILISVLALGVTGFFGNPNILSMHRFYRDRIGQAFLGAAGKGAQRIRLHELVHQTPVNQTECCPYPLINTCLNLLSRDDEHFPGAKMSDYFLLSPKYVGSKTTGYVRTDGSSYRTMTLSTAVAVSGAALNPNMGTRTNRILTFLMSLLNLQLGYWAFNPAYKSSIGRPITWWPYYHLLQLLCKTDSKRAKVNLSDGGHIENLAVYELLRRKVKLIVAVDAGDDPHYEFSDLKNLIIRARNELGITLTFPEGSRPEDRIRPSVSSGFSNSHFAIAEIGELSGKESEGEAYKGVLVYVKSSLRKPEHWREPAKADPDYWSYTYKTMHPAFPHESTADQFFDVDQWEAYYTLGRFMAGDMLGIDLRDPNDLSAQALRFGRKSVEELFRFFSAEMRSVMEPLG